MSFHQFQQSIDLGDDAKAVLGFIPVFLVRFRAIIPHIIGNPAHAYNLPVNRPNFSCLETERVVFRADLMLPYRIGIVAFFMWRSAHFIHSSRRAKSAELESFPSLYTSSMRFIMGVESTTTSPSCIFQTGALPPVPSKRDTFFDFHWVNLYLSCGRFR